MEMISVTDAGAESVTIDEDTNEVSTPVTRVLFQLKRWHYGTSKSSTKNPANSGFAPQPTCQNVLSTQIQLERDFA